MERALSGEKIVFLTLLRGDCDNRSGAGAQVFAKSPPFAANNIVLLVANDRTRTGGRDERPKRWVPNSKRRYGSRPRLRRLTVQR
jgi:hypothetical protein